MVRVEFMPPLPRKIGFKEVYVKEKDFSKILLELSGILKDLVDENGRVRGRYILLVNGRDYRVYTNIGVLSDNDTITIIPVIHGG